MANFTFLTEKQEYALFSKAAVEAEKVYVTSPAMCAIGCRKALELAVKWVYAADNTIEMPYKDNLQSLIHEPSFRFAMDSRTWGKLPYIVKLGNLGVHTERAISSSDAIGSLKGLFEFIEWLDYCYGTDYEERDFDEKAIPQKEVVVDTKKIKKQQSLIEQKDAEIEALQKQIQNMAASFTAAKKDHKEERSFEPAEITEFETRKRYIDVDLKFLGWKFDGNEQDVFVEYEVDDMTGKIGQKGYVDYVLFGKDGLPLAVIEAKRTSKDPNVGRKQGTLYADCLERKFGRRPFIFTTNGFETYFWDDETYPQRSVSSVFTRDDLQKLMNRRSERKSLIDIPIRDEITNRYYQKEAIRAVCDNIEQGHRKNLLVMATGTGKTRTASSLTDVLSRGGYVTNVLFLADRIALVKQAKDDFHQYLTNMSLCNLCSNKDEKNARIVFSTYPTILNAIDSVHTEDGIPLFSPAHFDLIIIDESHRSIFKKYRAIFEYFDAIMVGLTATPKTDVDRNTYEFFDVEHGVPTYAYDYETAVYEDHVLVPYYTYEVKTKFIEEGIDYDELSDEDKERYEEELIEDGTIPAFVPSEKLNKFIFNQNTVDIVLQDLMERGIKVDGGVRIGKTIIFAQNKSHAEYILERFNALYPGYKGKFAQRVICDDSYAQEIIEEFKKPDGEPVIAVSVDMMDTGIDVPECVNLVFFKKVRSKTKFWQMIGRGTRLAPELTCLDALDGEYVGKKRFLIFDYCGNFEFFREKPNGYEGRETKTLSESIYDREVGLLVALQDGAYVDVEYQKIRGKISNECYERVLALDQKLVSVRMKKQYVEKYSKKESFDYIAEVDKGELEANIAPLVTYNEKDQYALRFDNFIYGLMLSWLGVTKGLNRAKRILHDTGILLERKANIDAIKKRITTVREVQTDEFWESAGIPEFEKVREELRELIRYLEHRGQSADKKYLNLTDFVLEQTEGEELDPAYDFEDYRKKVNRYVEEHGNSLAIHKLTHNIPLTETDYQELERVLTTELGSKEDYQREYGDTPFGVLVRKIAKMDHEAAMEAFSAFINDESLNQNQIAFVKKVINHIENNGYMDVTALLKPPFDKPMSFMKLFDKKTRMALTSKIKEVNENATRITEIA